MIKIFVITLLACVFVQGVPFTQEGFNKAKDNFLSVAGNFNDALKKTANEGIEKLKETGESVKDAVVYGADAMKKVAESGVGAALFVPKVGSNFFDNIVETYKQNKAAEYWATTEPAATTSE